MLLTAIREIKDSDIQSIICNTAEGEDNKSITNLVSGIILGNTFKRMVDLLQRGIIFENCHQRCKPKQLFHQSPIKKVN